jgi:hypothetical protein
MRPFGSWTVTIVLGLAPIRACPIGEGAEMVSGPSEQRVLEGRDPRFEDHLVLPDGVVVVVVRAVTVGAGLP